MVTKIVNQKSDLGGLALGILYEKGYCGPPYDLSDVRVYVEMYKPGSQIDINFYDMDVSIGPEDKSYEVMQKLILKR